MSQSYISALLNHHVAEDNKKVHKKSPGSATIIRRSSRRHQEEEINDKSKHVQNKQANAREAHRLAPFSPSKVITMLKRMPKHEDKEHMKTLKHEAPSSINQKATQIKETQHLHFSM